MPDEGSAAPINSDQLELMQRRLIEAITTSVQSQLFKSYFAMGAVAITIVGFLGWNIIDTATNSVSKHIDEEYLAKIKTSIEDADQSIANINALLDQAKAAYAQVDTLTKQANESVHRINDLAQSAEPKIAEVAAFSDQLDSLNARSMDLQGRLAQSQSSSANLEAAVQQIPDLAKQVAALAELVAKIAPTATTRTTADPNQSTTAQDVAQSTASINQTATQAVQTIDDSKSQTIAFLQYNGIAQETAQKLADAVSAGGFIVPGIENVNMGDTGLSEVRYYYEGDEPKATELAKVANEAILNLGIAAKPVVTKPLIDWQKRKPKEGTIELWIGVPAGANSAN